MQKSSLPWGWTEHTTEDGDIFYHNFYTDKVQWDIPVPEEIDEATAKFHSKTGGVYHAHKPSSIPPCMVMIIMVIMMFLGVLAGLWKAVLSCLGFGPPDLVASAKLQQEHSIYLDSKGPQEVVLKPFHGGMETKEKKRWDVATENEGPPVKARMNFFNKTDPEAPVPTQMEVGEQPLENLPDTDPQTVVSWTKSLVHLWGKWLDTENRERLEKVAQEWRSEQSVRWNITERPLKLGTSEHTFDVGELDEMKNHIVAQLNQHAVKRLKNELTTAKDESQKACQSTITGLGNLKQELVDIENEINIQKNEIIAQNIAKYKAQRERELHEGLDAENNPESEYSYEDDEEEGDDDTEDDEIEEVV